MKSLKDAIRDAEQKGIALGHFNVSTFEQLQAVAQTARKLDAPVIVGVSEGERAYLGMRRVRDLVYSFNREYGQENGCWLFLNADHTRSLEKAEEAAREGCDAVLFDPLGGTRGVGGELSFEDHIVQTRAAVELVKSIDLNILVEGELGFIGTSSELLNELPKGAAVRPEELTRPEEAERFVRETGVDLLAPAVGNIHGMLREGGNPRLDIRRITELRKAAGVSLVLHGGSGIAESDLAAAVGAGVAIIHVSTELRVAWRNGVERQFREHPDEIAPYKLMPGVVEAVAEVVERKLRLFVKVR